MSYSKVHAFEKEPNLNKSQLIIANRYAEKFCSAKADNFFSGLESEKTLKYSYFRYIGFQSEDSFSKDMYKLLINQIRGKCLINNEEEREINEFFLENSHTEKRVSDKFNLNSRLSN
tara:strand:+ start:759 stop:1109 length:351 start_codon:yes stop_codon:yes gene_type:complete